MAEIRNGRVMLTVSEEELTEMETGGASGSGTSVVVSGNGRGLFAGWRRTGSFRNMRSFSSPRSVTWNGGFGRFFCEDEGRSHFLDACALCKKPLGGHRDIFMYRGDTPFCSEECRQEQIDMDEAKENNWSNLAMKASSRKERNTNNTSQRSIHVQATGAIVAG